MTYAASEDYWREIEAGDASDEPTIEIPLSDEVLCWIENHPDATPIEVLAQTGTDPALRGEVAEAVDMIHGDADLGETVDDDREETDELESLGDSVSSLPELRRPARGFNSRVLCPTCDAELSDTLGAPTVPTDRLHASASSRIEDDSINVRGYHCRDCSLVLAVDPGNPSVELGPSTGWLPVKGIFADGSKREVLVPKREVSL